ncbi:hypothetical protein MASR2M15_09540 [Anaerolineales bacterium]
MKKGLLIVIIFILLSTLIASAQSIQMPQVDLEEFYPEAKPFTSFAELERTKCDILVTADLLWGGFLIQPDGENMRLTQGFWPGGTYYWSPDGSMIMANGTSRN